MNVNVVKELLKNDFHVREKAKHYKLDDDLALTVIQKIIDDKGSTENIHEEHHPFLELVIQPLYQEEAESKTKWRDRMIKLANHVSEWSRDKNAKVGAVLVSKKGGDITLGYNGFPFGVKDDDERYDEKKLKLNIIVHAEVNAIIAAGTRAVDGHLYVVGKPICARCAGPIIQSGIKRVYAEKPKEEGTYEPPQDPDKTDWEEVGRLAVTMLQEAGVECIFYEPNENGTGYRYSDFK
ncbi:deoxycytidylate deaminase [Photobacterium ganghwense]|uniref:deoxycytidylate deaminase n=1 Tax=Photobacterium ganghwense TaxID=320778 RepID=UPI0040576FD4